MRESEIVVDGYDRIAEAYLEWTTRSPLRERWLNELSSILLRGGDALDLGCGAGMVARRLTEMGFSVLGIDGSSRQIALARKHEPRAEFRLADMVAVAFPAASFAAVLAFYSITHVRRAEHAALFTRIARWLKPGGVLIASLGYTDCPGWTGAWLGTTMFFSHFDAQTNVQLVEQAGLVIRQPGYRRGGERKDGAFPLGRGAETIAGSLMSAITELRSWPVRRRGPRPAGRCLLGRRRRAAAAASAASAVVAGDARGPNANKPRRPGGRGRRQRQLCVSASLQESNLDALANGHSLRGDRMCCWTRPTSVSKSSLSRQSIQARKFLSFRRMKENSSCKVSITNRQWKILRM